MTVTALPVYGQDDPLLLPSVGDRIAGLRHGTTLEGKHITAPLVREFVLAHRSVDVSG